MPELLLRVEQLRFLYDDMPMLFDLQVQTGHCLALIGPSGAGKTTLLNLIAGFAKPLSGRVLINNRDVNALPPALRPVTTVFQEHNLFPHLDVQTNIGLGIHPGLRLSSGDRARISEALARLGLNGLERRLPGQLSGGQRQRVALARALVRERPLLLLDEPFAALGPALRREMLELVTSLQQAQGLTIVLVSHHPDDARLLAQRTAFVWEGRILAEGPTTALLDQSDLPQLRDYLGEQ